MKKIFLFLNLILMLIFGSCAINENDNTLQRNKETASPQVIRKFSAKAIEGDIHIEAKNFDGEDKCMVTIKQDESLLVDIEVEQGRIELKIGEEVYKFDKTQKTLIDISPELLERLTPTRTDIRISLTAYEKFTGKLLLKSGSKSSNSF